MLRCAWARIKLPGLDWAQTCPTGFVSQNFREKTHSFEVATGFSAEALAI